MDKGHTHAKLSGRGFHKRRKKGARLRFDRRKNDERHWQQLKKEKTRSDPPTSNNDNSRRSESTISFHEQQPQSLTLESMKSDLISISLPKRWQAIPSTEDVQYCKMDTDLNGMYKVTTSIRVSADLSWSVYGDGKEVPATCSILTSYPQVITSPSVVAHMIQDVSQAVICPGNPDEDFVSLCKMRGSVMKGNRGSTDTVAFIDYYSVTDPKGQTKTCTVRRVDCDVLCKCVSSFPLPCHSCHSFRSTLRSSLPRHKSSSQDDRTNASSRTKYACLSSAEKDERMKNLHQSLKVAMQKVKRLEDKVTKLIEREGVLLQPDDAVDVSTVVNEMQQKVEDGFPPGSPQRIFWEQQRVYNLSKDRRQMRWHPLVIRFALNLKYLSSSAYRAVHQSGIISLPSERTLADYTHWTSPHAGVQLEFIEEFLVMLESDCSYGQHHCALSMDEMKIKRGLVFNKHTGSLTGFVDLGSANCDLEQAVSGEEQDTNATLAEHVFVFMARAVFKPSLTMPVAHCFSSNLKGEKIFPLAWEVIEALELYEIPVVSLTSDGAKPNRRFYNLCQKPQSGRVDVPYKTFNPYRENEDIYFFCDAPHLLKTARNCFSNSFAHSNSRKMEKSGQAISWKWIESLYLAETSSTTLGVRLCHKLTRDHVWLNSFSRMRVYLAAQVMSESVASALQYLDNDKTQQTRLFIRMIDRFFDCLNVRNPLLAQVKRKDSIAPYKSPNDERFKWLKEDFLGYLHEWEKEIDSLPGLKSREKQKRCLSRETLQGIKITELGPKLLKLPGVKYVLSEVFSQDPLERYFCRQRHRGGSNDNPTAYQVPYNAAILVQQQSIYRDLRTMNVQPDQEVSKSHASVQPLRKRKRQCQQ